MSDLLRWQDLGGQLEDLLEGRLEGQRLRDFVTILDRNGQRILTALKFLRAVSELTDVNLSSPADGEALVYDGTNEEWTNSSVGGGLVLIEAQTASSDTSISFTTGIDSTYDEYILALLNVIPSNDDEVLFIYTSTDGGSSFDNSASDYRYGSRVVESDTTLTTHASTGATRMELVEHVGSASGEQGANLWVHIIRPAAAQVTNFHWQGNYHHADGTTAAVFGSGQRVVSADVDALQARFVTGNIESGELKLYGVQKS